MSEVSLLLLAIHFAVIGYYMGSDIVVNQTCWNFILSAHNPPAERARQLKFLLLCDQHPRMGLIFFIASGFAFEASIGLWSVGPGAVPLVNVICAVWLANVWASFLLESHPLGKRLVDLDVVWRIALASALVIGGAWSLFGGGPITVRWMALKYLLLGLLIGGGVSIRFYVRSLKAAWPKFAAEGSTPQFEAIVWRTLAGASYVNYVLWAMFIAMAGLTAVRPELFGSAS